MESMLRHPLDHPEIVLHAQPVSPAPQSPTSSIARTLQSPSSPSISDTASPSALARHQLTRHLSPDLPSRDALYLFCNFSSYMRSPQEGAEGIRDNTDFHDTIRLLDYARTLAGNKQANVKILHMKYRFQTPDQGLPTTRQEKLNALKSNDDRGRRVMTVPQPFSTLQDSVVKVDYQDNGVFNPLPSQAVFQHISKLESPPPRIIVVSYVSSKATENHISSLAAWAFTSTPPIYVFSPLETRLRETRKLSDALHHAIPISMYAWPVGVGPPPIQTPSPKSITAPTSPSAERRQSVDQTTAIPAASYQHYGSLPSVKSPAYPSQNKTKFRSPLVRQTTNTTAIISPNLTRSTEYSPRKYPSDPVATLSVITDALKPEQCEDGILGDRVPLWSLAPGAGVLHGSTSASLGVKLSDFSAINLLRNIDNNTKFHGHHAINNDHDDRYNTNRIPGGIPTKDKSDTPKRSDESPIQAASGINSIPTVSLPPLDSSRRGFNNINTSDTSISRPSSAASSRKINMDPSRNHHHHHNGAELFNRHPYGNGIGGNGNPRITQATNGHVNIHLTPPEQDPRRLSPPDHRPAHHHHQQQPPTSLTSPQSSWPDNRSWPTTREKVPGWKGGRREVMEDALKDMVGEVIVDVEPKESLTSRIRQMGLESKALPEEAIESDIGKREADDLVLSALAMGIE